MGGMDGYINTSKTATLLGYTRQRIGQLLSENKFGESLRTKDGKHLVSIAGIIAFVDSKIANKQAQIDKLLTLRNELATYDNS